MQRPFIASSTITSLSNSRFGCVNSPRGESMEGWYSKLSKSRNCSYWGRSVLNSTIGTSSFYLIFRVDWAEERVGMCWSHHLESIRLAACCLLWSLVVYRECSVARLREFIREYASAVTRAAAGAFCRERLGPSHQNRVHELAVLWVPFEVRGLKTASKAHHFVPGGLLQEVERVAHAI